jgi:hypothetical protein
LLHLLIGEREEAGLEESMAPLIPQELFLSWNGSSIILHGLQMMQIGALIINYKNYRRNYN